MILDATCGLKQMWFRDDEKTVYLDRRRGNIDYDEKYIKTRPDYALHTICPTIQADNQFLPFKDGVFNLVLYDPPHQVSKKEYGMLHQKYTVLEPVLWVLDMKRTIKELFRVLKMGEFLIFKWSGNSKARKIALNMFPYTPLFGTAAGQYGSTYFFVFRKENVVA